MIFAKSVILNKKIRRRISRYKGSVINMYDLEKLNFKKIGYEMLTAKQ
jgi:hypothetical protein